MLPIPGRRLRAPGRMDSRRAYISTPGALRMTLSTSLKPRHLLAPLAEQLTRTRTSASASHLTLTYDGLLPRILAFERQRLISITLLARTQRAVILEPWLSLSSISM